MESFSPSESWRKQSWQTPKFFCWAGSWERKWRIYSKILPLKMIYSTLYSVWRVLIHTGMRAVQMKMQDHLISYRIVIICSSEMISKLLCLDLCFLYPFEYTADFTDAKLWEKIGKKRNFLLCEWCKRAVSVAEVSGGGNGNAPPMSSESQIFRGNFLSVEQSCQTSPDNA